MTTTATGVRRFDPSRTSLWAFRSESRAGGIGAALLALSLGIVYAVRVPPGLPYDEPAHWANVVFVAEHFRMPILGEPGSSYESQMGPVAYMYDAFWVRLWDLIGGSADSAFFVARLAGLIPLYLLFALVRRLVARSLTGVSPRAATMGAAVVVLNPMVMSMGMSVQNDVLALVFAFGAISLTLELPGVPRAGDAVRIGLLGGLAVLTKLTAWPVLPTIALVWLVRHRRSAIAPSSSLAASSILVCGWWFAQNLIRYGDVTARHGVEQMGYVWGPAKLQGVHTIPFLVRQFAAYLTLPVEYWRNTVVAPLWVEAVVALLLGVVSVGTLANRKSVLHAPPLVLLVSVISVCVWLLLYFTVQSTPVRFAYVALAGWSVCAAVAMQGRFARMLAGAALVALHLWCLAQVGDVAFGWGITP